MNASDTYYDFKCLLLQGYDPRVLRKADQPDFKQGLDTITIGYACDKFYEVNTTYGLSKEKVWGKSTAAKGRSSCCQGKAREAHGEPKETAKLRSIFI